MRRERRPEERNGREERGVRVMCRARYQIRKYFVVRHRTISVDSFSRANCSKYALCKSIICISARAKIASRAHFGGVKIHIMHLNWFRCYALATESTCSANDACDWDSGSSMCSAATAMMIVRRQNACPDSDYATLVTTATGGTESLDEFYATAQDSDPSIQPADGVSLSGVSGVAHSALALAASAAALVALA